MNFPKANLSVLKLANIAWHPLLFASESLAMDKKVTPDSSVWQAMLASFSRPLSNSIKSEAFHRNDSLVEYVLFRVHAKINFNAPSAVKVTFHSAIFLIPVGLMHKDQSSLPMLIFHRSRSTLFGLHTSHAPESLK